MKSEEKFDPILNGDARLEAQDYISNIEYNFYDGIKEVAKYKKYMHWTAEVPKNCYFGRIHMNNEDLISELHETSLHIVDTILNDLLTRYRELCKKYGFVI